MFSEPTPNAILETIRPDVLVKGGTYAASEVVGREVVEAYGGVAKVLGLTPGVSTTDIVRRLRNEASGEAAPSILPTANEGSESTPAFNSETSTLDPRLSTERRRKAG